MTAAVFRNTAPSLSVPQTQNTAPVLEFNCLYTHDVRRKQKRWQDGFLRFHTFNKRVMIYDIPRNFIGDTHWKADEAVQDGDEVTLEKDGVLVQVAESVGRTETDLTELRFRKKKTSSEHGSSPAKDAHTPAIRKAAGTSQKHGTQLKHRSLNTLLGTPKGPLGKATMPTKSPFEKRQDNLENEPWEEGRPPKRQRLDQSWNVTRTTQTPSVSKTKEVPLWARTSDAAKRKTKKDSVPAGQRRLGTTEVIELSDDEQQEDRFLPGFSSDVLAAPSSPGKDISPSKGRRPVQSPVPHSPAKKQTVRSLKQNAPKDNRGKDCGEPTAPSDPPAIRDDVPLSAAEARSREDRQGTTRRRHDQEALTAVAHDKTRRCTSSNVENETTNAESSVVKPAHTLRMAARSSRKKTLLCHDRLTEKPGQITSTVPPNDSDSASNVALEQAESPKSGAKSQRKLLEERLARIQRKSAAQCGSSETLVNRNATPSRSTKAASRARSAELKSNSAAVDRPMALAELDKMVTPPVDVPAVPGAPSAMAAEPLMGPPPKKHRQLQKAVSDVSKPTPQRRVPRAPMRYTPSPSKRATAAAPPEPNVDMSSKSNNALPPQTRARKAVQRAVSLNTTADGNPAVLFRKPFQTPKTAAPKVAVAAQEAPDPWSREAFDLIAWRPPGWDEQKWCRDKAGSEGGVPSTRDHLTDGLNERGTAERHLFGGDMSRR